ncbi:MAG: energy-coupling factor transporter ATPase [Ruminococcaceae bacterium]|nr:energy-coupling factor transporter ATPase [Oscillospiraceae bacterium]
MFKALDLTYQYDETSAPVLDHISLDITPGSFTALLGHNGSGKSTLAKHFNAFLLPSGGKVYIKGLDSTVEDNLPLIRRTAGMVFQNPDNQIVAAMVEDDVAFGPENIGIPTVEMRERVDEALKQVGMYEFRTHAPNLLSGGQKQRIAIAGIIAMRPEAILLDEPTAMLDPKGRREVLETITTLNKEHHITIVLITHHMNETIGADRLVVLNKGQIYMDGTPREIFTRVEELRAIGLEVPTTVALIHRLNQAGFNLALSNVTVEECGDAILKAIFDKKGNV